MATITYEGSADQSAANGTRPVILSLNGVRFRIEGRYPETEPRTRVAIEAWFVANVSAAELDAWAAQAAENESDAEIPDGWRRRVFAEAHLTQRERALIRELVDQLNVVRTDPTTVHAAITSTDILTGMRGDMNSTA